MPRRNRDIEKGFIWVPRDADIQRDIQIDGVSVLTDYLGAEFTKALCPDMGFFNISLINADGRFSNKFVGGETISLYFDFVDGTTKRFEGRIDKIMSKRSPFETIELTGGHVSSELLDLTVTREYTGNKTCDEILKELIDSYLTGYTYTNVASSTVKPNIKWSNKPFWNCVNDLCVLAVTPSELTPTLKRFDCYVDDDKDFHFFKENSIENNDEAIVWNDTLINLDGFGEEQTLVKNKIVVYGADDTGLPIIREALKSFSPWLKESIITDNDIINESIAEDRANSVLGIQEAEKEGRANCFALPSLSPGEKIWVSEPTSKIIQQIKIFKLTHRFPDERTEVILTKSRGLSNILREQILKDMSQEEIINPYEMIKSINFTFDDFDRLSSWDSNISISEGKIKLSSGVTGEFISDTFVQQDNITNCHILVAGEKITDTVYKISTDGGDSYTTATPNVLVNLPSGKDVILKVKINDIETEIDSIALLLR